MFHVVLIFMINGKLKTHFTADKWLLYKLVPHTSVLIINSDILDDAQINGEIYKPFTPSLHIHTHIVVTATTMAWYT